MGAGTDTVVGEYAGDGTIGLPVLGGGATIVPARSETARARQFMISDDGATQPLCVTDEDEEEEEDFVDLLFWNASDHDFAPPSRLGKGKGRAVVVDCVIVFPESVSAAAGPRMRRKSWHEALADDSGTMATGAVTVTTMKVRAPTQYLCLLL
ncbi:hypothetical protein H4582DRAFT_1966911 [Lactarius indigo]|nr:hypothetical protein H4582DRAFT_1966911 [Lactarius indigo]